MRKAGKLNIVVLTLSRNRKPSRINDKLSKAASNVKGGLGVVSRVVVNNHIPVAMQRIMISPIHVSRFLLFSVKRRKILERMDVIKRWGRYQSGNHSQIIYPGVAYKARRKNITGDTVIAGLPIGLISLSMLRNKNITRYGFNKLSARDWAKLLTDVVSFRSSPVMNRNKGI